MFDVGFWELLLIFGMGLMILGPERMPRVAAQIGRWIGRAQRTANQFRRKLQRELDLEDLVRDGIVPRHRPAAGPKTTTKSGNTPTTVPANAKSADAARSAEPAPARSVDAPPRRQPGGHQDPAANPSPASIQAPEASEASEAPQAPEAPEARRGAGSP